MFDSKRFTFHLKDPVWLGARARNAARRPLLIGLIAVGVIGLSVVSIALSPRQRGRVGPVPTTRFTGADTATLRRGLLSAESRARSADSGLAVTRQQMLAAAARPKTDSIDPALLRKHDSLTNILTDLQDLIGKVESAPLPTSYRALAANPALISNGKVVALLDSLRSVEKDRESLGTTESADPMYVALTSQLTEIGRSIEAVAAERRDSLRVSITAMLQPTKKVAAATPADTMPWVAERDSAQSAVKVAASDLKTAKKEIDQNRKDQERAAQISALSTSPFMMLIAAVVFGIAIGFAGALRAEVASPTVADEPELERLTGARVIATVGPMKHNDDIERRKANRLAPKYIDPADGSYQLAYLHVEQSVATPDIIAIAGDDPDVSAIVAMNLAAISAEDARSILVLDAAGESEAIRSLVAVPSVSDLSAILGGQVKWSDVTAQVFVGRDRSVAVAMSSRPVDPARLMEVLDQTHQELGKRYDTVFVIGGPELVPAVALHPNVTGTVLTAIAGRTPLKKIIEMVRTLHEKRQKAFGVVLWDGAAPRLAARPARRMGGQRKEVLVPA